MPDEPKIDSLRVEVQNTPVGSLRMNMALVVYD
jgi:hypothetical protein